MARGDPARNGKELSAMTDIPDDQTKARTFDANEGPGLRRLRQARSAEAIRQMVLADQQRAMAGEAPPSPQAAPWPQIPPQG
jgi:hypothetical protein